MSFEPLDGGSHLLLDPAAGDGSAIATLRAHWFPSPAGGRFLGVELEAERARRLEASCSPGDASIHADAFHLEIHPEDGASLLYLNPPYDHDRRHQRLEQRFLERWTKALIPGVGVLVFVVPFYALKASAAFLSVHYADLRAWLFPQPFFDAFRQCVVVGRRRLTPLANHSALEATILRWASDAPGLLPDLPGPDAPPCYRVAPCSPGLRLKSIPLDLDGLLSNFQPWRTGTFDAS